VKKATKDLCLALLLVLLWFTSLYFAAEVWLPTEWALGCGLVNALVGAALLVRVTWTEEGAGMFYDGPGQKEGWFIIAVMWSIPGSIFILGILWWGLRLILQLVGWWRL
jgi:hypothetical protein